MVSRPKVIISLPIAQDASHEYTLEISIVNDFAQSAFTPESVFRFTAAETLRAGDTTQVYKGRVLDDENIPYHRPVVCKVVHGDISDVEAEAQLYTSVLQSVQGKFVPLFVFYAQGTDPGSGSSVAALFTVYHGQSLEGTWSDVPLMTRCVVLLIAPLNDSRTFT